MNDSPFAPRRLAPWFIAALLGFICVWLGQLLATTRAENSALRDAQSLAALEHRALRNQLEAERILHRREVAELRRALPPQPPPSDAPTPP